VALIFFLTVRPPASREVTVKATLNLPDFFGLSLILTVLVLPAARSPAFLPALTPLPFTLSLTPVATAFPEFEILTL